jgi:CheY-like chemotaxis protein
VADDTADIRTLVQTVLGRDGIEVLTASNGAEALDLIFQEKPDAVVLDLAMPLLDGMEALERMAADPTMAQIPVMVLTSNSQAENVQRALRLGARDFMVKPFDPKTLRERVHALLATRPESPPGPVEESVVPPELRITPKVLVVDDHAGTVELARQFLRGRFDVVTAGTGPGALAAAARHQPDVILVDLSMPLMDGQDVLQRLQELPDLAGTKVLAMAAASQFEHGFPGFDGVVLKPLQPDELVDAVSQALGTSGLLSFLTQDDLVVLRVHASHLWAAPHSDLDPLYGQSEHAFARMAATSGTRLIVDLDELVDEPDDQLQAILAVVRTVLERAQECRLQVNVVAPRSLRAVVRELVADLQVEAFWSFDDARHGFLKRAATPPA